MCFQQVLRCSYTLRGNISIMLNNCFLIDYPIIILLWKHSNQRRQFSPITRMQWQHQMKHTLARPANLRFRMLCLGTYYNHRKRLMICSTYWRAELWLEGYNWAVTHDKLYSPSILLSLLLLLCYYHHHHHYCYYKHGQQWLSLLGD